jgi:protein-tyrosine phosphatase
MEGLRRAGVDVLVSTLTGDETSELELGQEAEEASNAGLRFFALPTPDRGVPDAGDFGALLEELGDAVRQGAHVAIHCRMGIGRSSLVAAGLLVGEGRTADEAWAAITQARGLDVPDTPEQKAWLRGVVEGA